KAGPLRAIRHLDLEHVSAGGDRVEVDRLEHASTEALEAARRIADAHVQEEPGVEGSPARDHTPDQPPVAHAAAAHVAGPEDEVGAALRFLDQTWYVGGTVREVAVDLEHQLGPVGQCDAEACEVC